jgi:hypothetical protein
MNATTPPIPPADSTSNPTPRRGAWRVLAIIAGVTLAVVGVLQFSQGIHGLFPRLGADADVTARSATAVAAAQRLVDLTPDVYRSGQAPRDTDPAVAPLLDAVFDVKMLRSKPALTTADLGALMEWSQATLRVGAIYFLAGTGVADFAKMPNDQKVLAQTDRNTVIYAPEVGRFLDAELALSAVMAEPLAKTLDDGTRSDVAKSKIRAGSLQMISGAIVTMALPGLTADWRQQRLAALQEYGPRTAKLLTSAQCGDLRQVSLEAASTSGDAAMQQGLNGFAAALSCGQQAPASP